jgi:hypothetical protein
VFAAQARWIAQGSAYLQANGAALSKLAQSVAFRQIADGAGLTAIGRATGLTAPQIAACFTPAALEALPKLSTPPPEVQGTPSFYLNGKLVTGVDWAALQPMLVAAGAR